MKRFVPFALVLTIFCSSKPQEKPLYKDPAQSVEKRVDDLLSRMTLQEKLAQLGQLSASQMISGQEVDRAKLAASAGNMSWGCVEGITLRGENSTVIFNAIQRYMVNETRLGIPVITVTESLHGSVNDGSTIFPQSVAIGATFDPELAYQMTYAVSKELYSQGISQSLSPGLDVVRDLRWGRVEESFGEDPYLVGMIGIAETKGYIDGGINPMIKPYGPGGATVGGLNLASVDSGERDLLNIHIKPYEMVVRNTSVSAVMSSYDSWNGIPNSSSHYLLTELLRDKWGFKGYVYSDWGAVGMLKDFQKVAATYADAAVMAISAGLDLEVGPCYRDLAKLVEEGKFDVSIIDRAVSRVLTVKFQMGLFEHPYRGEDTGPVMRKAETVALSRKIADESIVLLKNEGNILPLDASKLNSVAVIGPNADQVQFGDYTWSRSNKDGVTPLQGLKTLLGDKVKINYAQGCDRVSDSRDGFEEAVMAAEKSDVSLVFVGSASASLARDYSDATCGEGFDLSSLDLTGAQQPLLEAVCAVGKPVVLVLVTGKPFSVKWAKENVQAIAVQWYGGEKEGDAIASMLFGETVPCAKLPFSFPQSVGHLPCYYNHLPSDKGFYHQPGAPGKPGRDYVFSSPAPLWEFGYGLSYTSFEYAPMQIDKAVFTDKDTIIVKTSVTNTGNRDAKEVVQLYFNDIVSSVATPVRQLCAFKKVAVPAGKTVSVELVVPVSTFALYNRNMDLVVEPGEFELQLGASSLDIRQRAVVNVGKDEKTADLEEEVAVGKIGRKINLHGAVRDMQATPVGGVTIKSIHSGATAVSNPDGTYSIKTNEGDILELSKSGLQTLRHKVGNSAQEDITVYYKN